MTTQAATNALNLRDLYQRLLAINYEAFGGGQYDIAYDALMTALHCMEVLRDVPGLGAVKQVAEEQLAGIDAHAPDYAYSTPSTKKHKHPSIYAMLARRAKTRIQTLQAAEKWQALKKDRPFSEW